MNFDVVVYGVRLRVTPARGNPIFVQANCPSGDNRAWHAASPCLATAQGLGMQPAAGLCDVPPFLPPYMYA